MSFDHTIYTRLLALEGKVQRLEKIIVEQTLKELGVTASELRRELMHVVPAEAGGEAVAGGPTREDGKAVEAVGDKGPVTVNSPATDPAPAVCGWEPRGILHGTRVYLAACDGGVRATYGLPLCPCCKAPIKFTEAKT